MSHIICSEVKKVSFSDSSENDTFFVSLCLSILMLSDCSCLTQLNKCISLHNFIQVLLQACLTGYPSN